MREFLIAIGLEALYHGNNAQSFKAGAPVFSREIFIRGEVCLLLKHVEFLKALQAGIAMRPLEVLRAPPQRPLKLVQ